MSNSLSTGDFLGPSAHRGDSRWSTIGSELLQPVILSRPEKYHQSYADRTQMKEYLANPEAYAAAAPAAAAESAPEAAAAAPAEAAKEEEEESEEDMV